MGDIINLRAKRKEKKRGERDVEASQNRELFGQTKETRASIKAEKDKRDQTLDGAKLDD